MRANVLKVCLGCALTALFAGCGDGAIDTEAVTGVITLNGAPLADAMVNFTPAVEGQGTPSYAKTDESGNYKLQTLLGAADAGTTPGEYIVTVSKTDLVETGKTITNSDGTTSPDVKPKELLPPKYTDAKQSELRAKVVEGSNNFDFDLTAS